MARAEASKPRPAAERNQQWAMTAPPVPAPRRGQWRGAGAGADCAGVVETQRSARGYCGRAIRPKQSREKGKKCAHKKKRGGSSAAGGRCQAKKEGVKSERRSAVPNSLASQLAALGSRIPPRRRRAAAAEA